MKKKPRYQDYVNELAQGCAYGIFIDDSGSPGLKDTPANLHRERKTWVAVVVEPTVMPTVWREFPQVLGKLKESTGATEFHFADIYAGRKAFKNVDLGVRLGFFRFMATLFQIYKFPVIVQTLDPKSLADVVQRSAGQMPPSIPYFNFSKPSDTALFFLLSRLKFFMQKTPTFPQMKARVFVDEGFKKNGVGIHIPVFSSEFLGGLICFADSSSILPLQLADFAAFSLNRVQILTGRDELSQLDMDFLEIMSPISFNFINIEQRALSFEIREAGTASSPDDAPRA